MRYLISLSVAAALLFAACTPPETKTTPAPKSTTQTDYALALQKLADGVWVHTSTYTFPGGNVVPSNGLVVADGDELILVDTAWGEMATSALLDKIKTEIGKPVKKLILTHHHFDRLAGVDLLEKKGVEVFTHPATSNLSAARSTPIPNTSVAALKDKSTRSKVGPVEIAYPGPGHAVDNLVVYVPGADILFGGCLIRGKDQTTLGNTSDADIKAWPGSLAWTRATYPAKIVIPGHGQGGDLTLLDNTLKLLAKTVNAGDKREDQE